MSAPSPRRLVILTEGQWHVHNAKTAMGVIRFGPDRVVALLDSTIAGRNVAEWMSSPAAIASRMIERQAAGRRPPVGAMPMSSPSGRTGPSSASSSVATNGMSRPGRNSARLRPAIVESRMARMSSRP